VKNGIPHVYHTVFVSMIVSFFWNRLKNNAWVSACTRRQGNGAGVCEEIKALPLVDSDITWYIRMSPTIVVA
jgi:hypothetical protein